MSKVTFTRLGLTVDWDPTCESLLDLAESRGLEPVFSCRQGICHTCASRLVAGEVEYPEEPLVEPAPGRVLICCSRPVSDVVVEV